MSDYVYQKVIRLPFPEEILKICNTEDAFDCEEYIGEKATVPFNRYNTPCPYFDIGFGKNRNYLDLVLEYSYGKRCGDFGYVMPLTQNEIKKYRPYFDALNIHFADEDLRKVEFCWYNCSEPDDYYDIKEW